jgi:hypothetical protein
MIRLGEGPEFDMPTGPAEPRDTVSRTATDDKIEPVLQMIVVFNEPTAFPYKKLPVVTTDWLESSMHIMNVDLVLVMDDEALRLALCHVVRNKDCGPFLEICSVWVKVHCSGVRIWIFDSPVNVNDLMNGRFLP